MLRITKSLLLILFVSSLFVNHRVSIASENRISLYLECNSENSKQGIWIDIYDDDYSKYPSSKVCINPEVEIVPLQDGVSIVENNPDREFSEQHSEFISDFLGEERHDQNTQEPQLEVTLKFSRTESEKLSRVTATAGDENVRLVVLANQEFVSHLIAVAPLDSGSVLIIGGGSLYQYFLGDSAFNASKSKYEYGVFNSDSIDGEKRLVRSKEMAVPTRIKAELGSKLGIRYTLPPASKSNQVSVDHIIEYPSSGLTNPITEKSSKGEIAKNISINNDGSNDLVFSFNEDWKIEKGVWTFYIIVEGDEYISHQFDLY